MLENWCYESEPLLLMSGHVDDHSQKMPAELLQSIIDSKKANAGVFNKRQCILGLFDQVRLEWRGPAISGLDDQQARLAVSGLSISGRLISGMDGRDWPSEAAESTAAGGSGF